MTDFCKESDKKKFFKRYTNHVQEHYLYNKEELQQKLATIHLFEKFDADGSGALDYQELAELYNQNGVLVSEDEIKNLYNSETPKFTLNMFESITKDAIPLRHYRLFLHKI